ncbi:MAG TPA: serine/threonine-protein kinase [Chloroflexia bacterium]|nr:serine/threonine-protein kinase [Chloroflexia bacterium]
MQDNPNISPHSDNGNLIFGRYRLLKSLGKGSFGEVFQAEDIQFDPPRSVALKLLRSDYVSEAQVRADLKREASILARFNHPNILRVIDFGISQELAFIVTDLAPGGSLAQKLRPDPGRPPVPLPLEAVSRYLDQIADALDDAHAQGLVHRDIKPQNILLDQRDRPLLADFGLAAAVNSSASSVMIVTGTSGTPLYMAPEQWQGQAGRASDIYALGALTYQLVTGQPPFLGSQYELMGQHLTAPVPTLSLRAPGLTYPPALDEIISAAMAKDPRNRLKPAKELAARFKAAIDNAPLISSTVPFTGSSEDTAALLPEITASIAPMPMAVTQPASTVPFESETSGEISPAEPLMESAAKEKATSSTQPNFQPVDQSASTRHSGPPIMIVAGQPSRKGFYGIAVALALLVTLVVVVLLLTGKPGSGPALITVQSGVVQAATVSVTGGPLPATVQGAPAVTFSPTASATFSPTAPVTPAATLTATTTPALTPTSAAATATSAPVRTASSNPLSNQGSGGVNPPPVPAAPTTVAPLPTATFTPVPVPKPTNTPVPCAFSTRRGFGQVYATHATLVQKLGCPTEDEQQATLAYQPFENGAMLYVQASDQILVLFGKGDNGSWQIYPNSFRFSDPTPTPFPNPFGCTIAPINGFNKLWANDSSVRSKLGCATAPENSSGFGASQRFERGTMFYYPTARNGQRIYVLTSDGQFVDLPNTYVG